MNSKEQEYSQWENNDSLLQSYRSNMITSQSLLIAAAAVFYQKSCLLVIAACLVGLFSQWYIWFGLIRARFLVADYHKFNAVYDLNDLVRSKTGLILTEDLYVNNREKRKAANRLLAQETGIPRLKSNWRHTRRKLDILLPATYSVIWILLLILTVVSL